MINASEEFKTKARSICYFHANKFLVEDFVKKVAEYSGQQVDWGYSCGIADVFFIGDYNKVRKTVLKFKPELDDACIKDAKNNYQVEITGAPRWRLF